jgi:hypothetical protein
MAYGTALSTALRMQMGLLQMGLFMQVKGALKCYIAEVESFPVESNCGIMKSLLVFCTQNQSLLDTQKVFLLQNFFMNSHMCFYRTLK